MCSDSVTEEVKHNNNNNKYNNNNNRGRAAGKKKIKEFKNRHNVDNKAKKRSVKVIIKYKQCQMYSYYNSLMSH